MHKGRLALAAGLALVSTGAAQGVTTPGRIITETAPVVAISVTGPGFTYAVADNAAKTDCAHVVSVLTGGTTQRWRLGKPTNEPCSEGLSTGGGISAVAMSEQRSLWIQYAGGNLRDWQLFTATRTSRTPRQLAFVEQDVDLPSPIVLGQGIGYDVPYAVKNQVTLLGDNGAAEFKWTAPAPVRLLADGLGTSGTRVAAYLDSGELDLLSAKGKVIGRYSYPQGAVSALFLARLGVLVQTGTTVQLRNGAAARTFTLPKNATMIGYAQGHIYYSLAGSIHALGINSLVDSLLVPATPGKTTVASYGDGGGFAWATGNAINWIQAKA